MNQAKNLVPDGGGKATKVGEKVLELQRKLPSARIVYCSATGAYMPCLLAHEPISRRESSPHIYLRFICPIDANTQNRQIFQSAYLVV